MKTNRLVATVFATILCATLVSTTTIADGRSSNQYDRSKGHDRFDESCLPGIENAVQRNRTYRQLHTLLVPERQALRSLLNAVTDQTSYAALLTKAESVASKTEGGRVVVTLPDGTVVLDTAADDDPSNTMEAGNSYDHFLAKTVNENHNSRVAIFAAQLYPCGVGVESKLSTTTGITESYVAIRLGQHLNSVGTVRLSVRTQASQTAQ